MADIVKILNTIKTAIYGRDMRQAIHDGIEHVNQRCSDLDAKINNEITNREKADATHAAETATDEKCSHVLLSDSIDSDLNAATGKTAATPHALKALAEQVEDKIVQAKDQIAYIIDDVAEEKQIREREDAEIRDEFQRGDTYLSERISIVEAKAHTHDNKDILDGIDADRVRKWDDGSEGQITLGEYLEHLAEAERQFGMLWGLLGMNVYDGGWFGMEQIDAPLDGGDFDGTEFIPLDCGGFEPYVIPSGGGIGTVVDGGTY